MALCNFRLFGYAHEHVYNLIRPYLHILLLDNKKFVLRFGGCERNGNRLSEQKIGLKPAYVM